MINKLPKLVLCLTILTSSVMPAASADPASGLRIFNVKDYGATGRKADNAQAAIQKAVDACAAAGGGMVYIPPGEYSSGTIHLRSHVRLHAEAGATVYSIHNKALFDKDALLYGEDLDNITIEGRGVFDGEAAYDWRLKGDHQDDFIRPNQLEMEKLGKPLFRSFPKPDQTGKMLLLVRCKDVRISGVSFIDSPSWTMHPVHCERMVIDGIFIRTSLKNGVWADGIDPDCCKDLRISNCAIETGDDALVFYSMDWFGPATPCENITVTNCRLSSASSAIKFCDGNIAGIRNVTIDNCVITNSNRGIAFMTFDGGPVENVVLSNLTIETVRNDWFWWGDGEPFHFNIRKRSEVHANWPKEKDRPAGAIRNIKIQNVIARGYGMSVCNGHPDSWLDGVSFENVKLTIAHDPKAPYDKAVQAIKFELARNLRLKDFEVVWEKPLYDRWQSALSFEDVKWLVLDGVRARQAKDGGDAPAIVLRRVNDAVIRNCRADEGTGTFLFLSGRETSGIVLAGNDLRWAKTAFTLADGAGEKAVEIKN
ncbi:MAG: glycosyl hydrolase family 28 protein [Candidatus Aminicenantales bacterium]